MKESPEQIHKYFARLRALLDQWESDVLAGRVQTLNTSLKRDVQPAFQASGGPEISWVVSKTINLSIDITHK